MKHPARKDGTLIRDSICEKAYRKEIIDFQKLERALGELHTQHSNPVKYQLVNMALGWKSEGQENHKVKFFDMPKKGELAPLLLYIIHSPIFPYNKMHMQRFMDVVLKNKPMDDPRLFKIVNLTIKY